MLILLLQLPAGLAACFTAASVALADRLSVQVLMLWLVRLLIALASNSSRLHDPSSHVHRLSMHQYNATVQWNRRMRPKQSKHLGLFSLWFFKK